MIEYTPDQTLIAAALQVEFHPHSTLLPRRVIDRALAESDSDLSEYYEGAVKSGQHFREVDTLYARKSREGLRPLSLLSMTQRVHLQALVQAIKAYFPTIARGQDEYEAFTSAPLEDANARYIVVTDVTAFYQYVDHDLLAREILRRCGEELVASEIAVALNAFMGRAFGLPQLIESSEWLSEVYIDAVERRMLRQGLRIWRYNDDFRIAVDSWADAAHAIEKLTDALRALGLVPNDEKTYVLRRQTYERWAREPERRWAQLVADNEIEPVLQVSYTEELIEIDRDAKEAFEAAYYAVYELWREAVEDVNGVGRLETTIRRRLLVHGLRSVGTLGSGIALEHLPQVVAYEPQMTPTVARYLARLVIHEGLLEAPAEVMAAQNGRIMNHASPWQSVWLSEPFIRGATVTPSILPWLEGALEHGSGILKGRSALALARSHSIEPSSLLELYDAITDEATPEVVAALVVRYGGDIASAFPAVYRDGLENRIVAEWAANSLLTTV